MDFGNLEEKSEDYNFTFVFLMFSLSFYNSLLIYNYTLLIGVYNGGKRYGTNTE